MVFVHQVFLAIAAYFGYKFIRAYVKWITSPLRAVPGSKRNKFSVREFFFGDFFRIFAEPFMQPHERWWKQANEASGKSEPLICYSGILGRFTLLVMDADLVKLILMEPAAKEPMRFEKRYYFLKQTLGDALVTLEGENWSRHRRIIQPSFNTAFLKQILNAHVPDLTVKLVNAWKKAGDREIDVESHMSALTLDIIGQVAFSHEFHALQVLEEWANDVNMNQVSSSSDPLIKALRASLRPSLLGIVLSVFELNPIQRFFSPSLRKTRKALKDATDAVIAEARSKMEARRSRASFSTTKHKSLLQSLFDAKDAEPGTGARTLNDEELCDEIKTFLLAGHETTATWCYWALYALGQYPDIQEKVFQDVHKNAPRGTDLDWETVENMSYFGAFLNEVLRLYSPVGMIFRYTARPERWNGVNVPVGTRLVISFFLLHRHPDYWTNPEVFAPERWLNNPDMMKHRFAFLPFSAGGRNCIGQRFAQVEAKLILAHVIRSFQIQLAPSIRDKDLTFTTTGTMKGKPAVKICVTERK